MDRRLLDIKQTAKYLGITEPALRKRIYLNVLSEEEGLIRWERRLFFDKIKLDQYIENINK